MKTLCPLCSFSGTPEEMFRHFGDRRNRDHNTYSSAQFVAKAVGIERYSSGFPDIFGDFKAGGLTIVVKPAAKSEPGGRSRKSSAHRIFVECPVCLDKPLVPAGRIHQHKHSTRHRSRAQNLRKSSRNRYTS